MLLIFVYCLYLFVFILKKLSRVASATKRLLSLMDYSIQTPHVKPPIYGSLEEIRHLLSTRGAVTFYGNSVTCLVHFFFSCFLGCCQRIVAFLPHSTNHLLGKLGDFASSLSCCGGKIFATIHEPLLKTTLKIKKDNLYAFYEADVNPVDVTWTIDDNNAALGFISDWYLDRPKFEDGFIEVKRDLWSIETIVDCSTFIEYPGYPYDNNEIDVPIELFYDGPKRSILGSPFTHMVERDWICDLNIINSNSQAFG